MSNSDPKTEWTTISLKRDVKDKYDEAVKRTRYPLNVVADIAIDKYLASLNEAQDAA